MNFFCNVSYFLAIFDSCNPAFNSILWAVQTVSIKDVSGKCDLEDEFPCRTKWGKRLRFPARSNSLPPKQRVDLPERPRTFTVGLSPKFIYDSSIARNFDMKKAELSFGIATNIIKKFGIISTACRSLYIIRYVQILTILIHEPYPAKKYSADHPRKGRDHVFADPQLTF